MTQELIITLLILAVLAVGFAGFGWHRQRQRARNEAASADDVQARINELDEKLQNSQNLIHQLIGALPPISAQMGQLSERVNTSAESLRTGTQGAMEAFRKSTESRLNTMSQGIGQSIADLRASNEQRLEQIRQTVNEQLQTTLERRLREQFQIVSNQLQNVHAGLGEMQALSSQVGDLQRVLTRARDRGQWGEVILKDIIRQILTDGQYEENVIFGGNKQVEFAIRIPVDGGFAKLPVDSKFPMDDYQRMVEAEHKGEDTTAFRKNLLQSIEASAKTIREKYIRPPESTDFAFLFLPTDGLYAVAASEPGFVDKIQQAQKVRITGPDNFALFLSAVRMGFQLFAAGQRANEIRDTLAAVKTEFGQFGKVLGQVRKNLEAATKNIDNTERRVRAMQHKISEVGELPSAEAAAEALDMPPTEEDNPR